MIKLRIKVDETVLISMTPVFYTDFFIFTLKHALYNFLNKFLGINVLIKNI